jgi:hypothetical protein
MMKIVDVNEINKTNYFCIETEGEKANNTEKICNPQSEETFLLVRKGAVRKRCLLVVEKVEEGNEGKIQIRMLPPVHLKREARDEQDNTIQKSTEG